MHIARCLDHLGDNLPDTGFETVGHFAKGRTLVFFGDAFLLFTLGAHFFHFDGFRFEDIHRPRQIADLAFLVGVIDFDIVITLRQTQHIFRNIEKRSGNTATDHQRDTNNRNQDRQGNTTHHQHDLHENSVYIIDVNTGGDDPAPRFEILDE